MLLSQILLACSDDDTLVVLAHLLAGQVVHGVVKVNVSVNVVDAIDIVLIGNHYPFVRNDSSVGSDDVAFLFVVVSTFGLNVGKTVGKCGLRTHIGTISILTFQHHNRFSAAY